jgi:hypothetical protein
MESGEVDLTIAELSWVSLQCCIRCLSLVDEAWCERLFAAIASAPHMAIAVRIYGAASVVFSPDAESKLKRAEKDGFGHLPVCMAKTQNSISDKVSPTIPDSRKQHLKEAHTSPWRN